MTEGRGRFCLVHMPCSYEVCKQKQGIHHHDCCVATFKQHLTVYKMFFKPIISEVCSLEKANAKEFMLNTKDMLKD